MKMLCSIYENSIGNWMNVDIYVIHDNTPYSRSLFIDRFQIEERRVERVQHIHIKDWGVKRGSISIGNEGLLLVTSEATKTPRVSCLSILREI